MVSGLGRLGRDVKEFEKIMERLNTASEGVHTACGDIFNLNFVLDTESWHLNLGILGCGWHRTGSAKETPDSICNKILRK